MSYRPESRCDICGFEAGRLSTALAWYRDGGPKAVLRCEDHDACRRRVIAAGEEWPLQSADEARRSRDVA